MFQRDYKRDREWADSYESQVLEILNQLMPHLVVLCVAPDATDRKQATDFEVKMKGGSIAVRLRDTKECRWRDLTIRSRRDNGTKTELAKIKEGYAFRYFYGWIDENGIISEWILVDLARLRQSGLLEKPRREIPNTKNGKPDGTHFIYITIKELCDTGCLIASMPPRLETKNSKPSRNVNKDVPLEEGMKRARRVKCYNPRVENISLWEDDDETSH